MTLRGLLPLRVSACGLACAVLLLARSSLAGDGICGEQAAATLDGIPAYAYCGNTNVWTDNGVDTLASSGGNGWTQTEGGYGYQCVEFAVRYFYFKWNVSRNWFVGYAKDMCGTHPADVSVTTSPVHGDIAVITPGCGGADATAGHVGAVESVSSSTFVMVQQNPAGTYTWPKSCVSCFLHASGNGGGPSDPCASAPSGGYYCGQSTQWGGGTPNDLYLCQNGVTVSKTPCACGCDVEPAGTDDKCASSCTPDAGSGDGASDAAPHDGGSRGADSGSAPAPDAGSNVDDSGAPFAPPPGADASGSDDGGDSAGSDAATGGGGGCAIGGGGADAPLFGAGVLAVSLLARRRRRRRGPVVGEHPRA